VAATAVLKQLLSGIDFLHSKNIVHRDLKVGYTPSYTRTKLGSPTLFAAVLTPKSYTHAPPT
jgi:serine/threonine protein kinase